MNLAQEYVTGVNQERRGMEATISQSAPAYQPLKSARLVY